MDSPGENTNQQLQILPSVTINTFTVSFILLPIMNRKERIWNALIIILTLSITISFNINFGKQHSHYFGDALGYYMYLPSTLIYHNLKSPEKLPEDDPSIAPSALHYADQLNDSKKLSPKGIAFMQYTYGVALLELPFFTAAHIYELTIGGHSNGFTHSYSTAIWIGNFIYAILALLVVYNILRRYFTSTISLLTVCCLLLGTNLFWFSVYQYGMSHVPIMLLYSLLMLLTIKVYENPKNHWFILLGLIIGLIVIIRPTDIVCIFIPLLYNVYNKETFINKIKFIALNKLKVLALIAAAALPVIPQLLYWKMVSGSYIFYSYGQQSFNWAQPKIVNGLFYFSNGWLPYSLVMIFSIAGLLLYRKYKNSAWSIFIVLPIYIYIIYSWYCYNYINGIGSRPMIHMYPLLALPLAAFLYYVSQRGVIIKTLCSLIILFMFSVNYSFSMLKAKLIFNTDNGNAVFASQVLYKSKMNYNDLVVYDLPVKQPDNNKLSKIAVLAYRDFEDSSLAYTIPDPTNKANMAYEMKEDEYMPDGISIVYDPKIFKGARWIKASGKFYTIDWPEYPNKILVVEIKRGEKIIEWYGVSIDNKLGIADKSCKHKEEEYTYTHFEHRLWAPMYYYAPIPKDILPGDKITCFVWNPNRQKLLVDNISLEIYK